MGVFGLMKTCSITMCFYLGLLSMVAVSAPEELHDGQIKREADGRLVAWDEQKKTWLGVEAFWRSYADRRGGLTWGQRKDYPPYEQVKEFDTLIIELKQGPCLMEFFHARWRRGNDVRRWHQLFNEYGSCPHVFD